MAVEMVHVVEEVTEIEGVSCVSIVEDSFFLDSAARDKFLFELRPTPRSSYRASTLERHAKDAEQPPSLYLWIWSGDDVLKNYASGIAAVIAATEEEAWEKLKAAEIEAFNRLKYGAPYYIDSEEELQRWFEDDPEDRKPEIKPTRHELESAPAVIKWGSQ